MYKRQGLFHPANKIQESIGRVIVMADAAHAFGATWKGKPVGSIADFSNFSFHAVKNFTTAEGGAAVWKDIEGIDNEEIYHKYQLLSLHGQSKDAQMCIRDSSLAASLAEGEKKVLFIDADLRKSVLLGRHKVVGDLKGLSHFLSGQAELKDVITKTQDPNLSFIFAGVVPPNPAELLGTKKFAGLINGARKSYDYVIIDAPPLGSVIYAAIISKNCDASVLVISCLLYTSRCV